MGGWKLKAALTEHEREHWLAAKRDFDRVRMLVSAVERQHAEIERLRAILRTVLSEVVGKDRAVRSAGEPR